MSWVGQLRRYLRDARRGRRMSAEIDEELQFHLDAIVRELRQAGVDEVEARRQAAARFGRMENVRDHARRAKGVGLAEDLVHDLRYGARAFLRQPGFTTVAVLTLALAMGAVTAMFTLVNAVLIESLPYPNPDRLVFLYLRDPTLGISRGAYGEADFLAVAGRQRAFESVAATARRREGFTWTGGAEPEQVQGTEVTSSFFSVLGVRPTIGRVFEPGEDAPGRPLTVVVSASFYRHRLQSDPAAIGRSVTLGHRGYTVIGVMPPGFSFGARGGDEVWPILQLEPPGSRPPYYLAVIGRLKAGTTGEAAGRELARIAAEVRRQFPQSDAYDAVTVPMKEVIVGDTRTGLLVLLGAVGLVLLIAVVNVTSLQLARGAGRDQEIGIRLALGAGRLRIVRQLAAEGLVLASAGGVLGILLAWWSVRLIVGAQFAFLPRVGDIAVNGQVLAFTAGVVLLTAVVCGLAPARRARRIALDTALKPRVPAGARGDGGSRSHAGLVVAQVAIALVLLVGAGLLARSLVRLGQVDPGYEPGHTLTMRLSLAESRYPGAPQVAAAYREVIDRVAAQPGVTAAAISQSLPPDLLLLTNPFHLEGQTYEPGKATQLAEEVAVSSGYFRALGIPLLAGRLFDETDRASNRPVLIVNEAMARRFLGGKKAVGQRIQTGEARPESPWETIIGVVGNVKYQGLAEPDQPTIYVPFYSDGWNPWFVRSMFLVVRTAGDPEHAASASRKAIWSFDREIPISDVRPLDALFSGALSTPRFRTAVLSGFAVLALGLAALGVYGVLAYSVVRRTHEIGVRMAVGASAGAVVRQVLREGLAMTLVGILIGGAVSLALARVLSTLLFATEPSDPLTFGAAVATLLAVAACAAYVPARRAARVDPIRALKCE